jgi:O-antigen/teichoic acid export membrane protein
MSQPEEKRLSTEAEADIKVVAKGGAIQLVGQITERLLSFFFQVVFVRLLGAAPYGLYKQVQQLLVNASQLGLAGFNYAGMRFITKARAEGNHAAVTGTMRVALGASGIASLAVFAALLVFAPALADPFGESSAQDIELTRLIRIGAAFVPLFAILQVLRYCTQAYKTMAPSVIAGNIVRPVSRFVLGVAVLLAGFEVAGAVVTFTISAAIAAVVAAWYLRRMLTEPERAAKPRAEAGPIVRFALPQAGSSLLGIQTLGLGILILGYLSTDRAVGLFAIALSLQGIGNVFLGGIVNIWAPVVSDLHSKGEMERLGSLYKTINRWVATFSLPFLALLMLEPDVFMLFFGDKAEGAAPIIVLLAIGNVFYTGTGPTGYLISMTGHPGVNFVNSAISVAAYIALGLWIVPEHGAVGMAAVDAGVTAFINTLRVIEAKVLVGLQPFGKNFFKPVVATLAGAGVLLASRLITDDNTLAEVAAIATAALVYVAVLKVLGLDEEELVVWKRIRRRALKRGGNKKAE